MEIAFRGCVNSYFRGTICIWVEVQVVILCYVHSWELLGQMGPAKMVSLALTWVHLFEEVYIYVLGVAQGQTSSFPTQHASSTYLI